MAQFHNHLIIRADPYDVVAVIQEFDPVLVEMKYLDREHNLVEIPMPQQFITTEAD